MKYLFILGRNPELSIAELESYFEKTSNLIISQVRFSNAILVELKYKIEDNLIDKLGGTVSIGEVIALSKTFENIINILEKTQLTSQTKNKFNYSLWNFSNSNAENFTEYLKQRFKKEKFKATEKKIKGTIKLENERIIQNIPSDSNIQEQYFIFQGNELSFGKIKQIYNSKEQEKRDMSKPIRREELAISPRLAKILINLSQTKENETLLDPFCGIGVILQEALLQKIKVIGIDKDNNAIASAEKNLQWANFSKENYKLMNEDSTKMKIHKNIDAIATEPHLGTLLKEIPSEKEARKMLNDFENLIIQVLNNLSPQVKGKIVFTSPYIKIKEKRGYRISISIEKIIKATNLKLINKFQDTRENQTVGRNIIVLNKK